MNNYRELLIARNRRVQAAVPTLPDEPLTLLQYRNRKATERWRRRMEKSKG